MVTLVLGITSKNSKILEITFLGRGWGEGWNQRKDVLLYQTITEIRIFMYLCKFIKKKNLGILCYHEEWLRQIFINFFCT